ncbi:hypothetical protein [Marinomonas foliarum]|uniref:Holin n=1 Tax=Marinomonas foliarum TaxID=491950 RepID=A0A369AFC0_9GAMM|nr:hypothetical protein [Marinomonas foliarum]RCX07058.1 hypothetical protein DFP77_107158 [Marinomonas foliarum]
MIDNATANSYITSGGVLVMGGLTANEVAMYGGLFFAGATYLTNLIFKIKAERRGQRLERRSNQPDLREVKTERREAAE